MDAFVPRSLDEALELRAAHPEARPGRGRDRPDGRAQLRPPQPAALLDLSRRRGAPRLAAATNGADFVGAGMTFARIARELHGADRRSPRRRARSARAQIRNRATIGGNLGTASPAGDSLPVLAAYESQRRSSPRRERGTRTLPWDEFLVGPKRTRLAPDELIVGVEFEAPTGPGSFAKVGPRNAMVIAVAGRLPAARRARPRRPGRRSARSGRPCCAPARRRPTARR